MIFLTLVTLLHTTASAIIDDEKVQFCKELHCDDEPKVKVCGLRLEGEGVGLKLFDSECDLMKFGCLVSEEDAYGLARFELCKNAFMEKVSPETNETNEICPEIDCSYPGDDTPVCAIRKFEAGYKIRLFKNKCEMFKQNCERNVTFTITDLYICNSESNFNKSGNDKAFDPVLNATYYVVVNGSMMTPGQNYNESIDNFFAATHITDIPLKEFETNILIENGTYKEQSRRASLPLPNLKPMKAFKPWIFRPAVIKTDPEHMPLINSCYHKCPIRCPDTYAPVCGTPGGTPLEPALVFRNHCFMDAAQCKFYKEEKSASSLIIAYIPTTFFFCMGDIYGRYLRFLPLIRSLQRMGRLKSKINYKHVVKQFRNFYSLLPYELNTRG